MGLERYFVTEIVFDGHVSVPSSSPPKMAIVCADAVEAIIEGGSQCEIILSCGARVRCACSAETMMKLMSKAFDGK